VFETDRFPSEPGTRDMVESDTDAEIEAPGAQREAADAIAAYRLASSALTGKAPRQIWREHSQVEFGPRRGFGA